jgi:methyl-accepting chemotaxis protein
MQLGSKAMGMTGIETIELTRQVVGAGKALDMDLNQAMADFNQMAPELSQFGDKMVDVFAKLEAQSKATGIAAGTLLQTAMRFDTFEGAAKAAGQLNAILGDTVVDTMALIHASPDEKIDMLRDSLSAAGKEFDTMHRREQQVIASSLGVASVAEARQLLNKSNTDAFAEFVDKVDDGKDAFEASDAEIKKLAQTAASITDILGGLASKMAGTMQGATNVIRFTAEKAYDAGTAVADVVGPKYDAPRRC